MNDQASTQSMAVGTTVTFSTREWHAVRALRVRYQKSRDLFSTRELAYLRFQLWLYRTGQLVP